MTSARFPFVVFVGLLVGALGTALPSHAQERTVLPSERYASLNDAASVPLQVMPPVDVAALRAEDRKTEDRIGPLRYGTVIDTRLSPNDSGQWERLPTGNWVWRLRLQSRDAVSVSLAFTRFDLPVGATLFVYGPDREVIRGPYTRDDATAGQHWTPIVHGEELIVELEVPRNQRKNLDLTIGKVVHAYRSLREASDSPDLSKSGTCNLDVACDEADPWRNEVRSVARFTFQDAGGTFVCSGSLVNNTQEDNRPLFLTAEHCVSSAQIASSMVFYWNYENPTCRTQGTTENATVTSDDPNDQTSSGAILRARYGNTHATGSISGKPDLSLVEIDDTIPLTYDLYFSGWSREGLNISSSTTIHHPQGHGKRISFDTDATSFVDYPTTQTCQAPAGDTHLVIDDWSIGTTEGGSSGSPLFNPDREIVGVLSGGCAGCGGDGDADDNNRPDWYGRIAPGFENGDYQGATLADWLDPTNSGTQTLDGVPQIDADDSTPPDPIDDLRVVGIDTTQMTLEWTATGDDGSSGSAFKYTLRYDTNPINSDTDFQNATDVTAVPRPKVAGSVQQATATGLVPDSTYHFAIRATDDGLNESTVGSTSGGTTLPDKIAPAPIADFRISNVSTSNQTVRLKWTATGDDSTRGRSTTYDLRYANTPITTTAEFQNATRVTGLSTPLDAGQTETITLGQADGLEEDETYYFALVARDNAGNTTPRARPDRIAVLTKQIRISKGGLLPSAGGATSEAEFVLTSSQNVRVALYDLLGRRVRVLFEGEVREGFRETVRYDTNSLSSGPYFLRFTGETFTETRKIMIVK